eukprot:5379446-Amphidinium_carterae.1
MSTSRKTCKTLPTEPQDNHLCCDCESDGFPVTEIALLPCRNGVLHVSLGGERVAGRLSVLIELHALVITRHSDAKHGCTLKGEREKQSTAFRTKVAVPMMLGVKTCREFVKTNHIVTSTRIVPKNA